MFRRLNRDTIKASCLSQERPKALGRMKLLGMKENDSSDEIKIPNIKERVSILKNTKDIQKSFRAFSPPPFRDGTQLQATRVAKLLKYCIS
mmetsp:Transcript_5129/g.4339  ORF Transcript_5129/g.4339 Transcript_5129/m.4339 type:complete len:91 (+) Transcript_5129:318-590(+)